jgi:hypothetical protein
MKRADIIDALEPVVRWVATGCFIAAVFLYLWGRR